MRLGNALPGRWSVGTVYGGPRLHGCGTGLLRRFRTAELLVFYAAIASVW